jgi:adenylate cyclase
MSHARMKCLLDKGLREVYPMTNTVVGNQVNIAARLESMAKPGEILISRRTYSKAKDIASIEEAGTFHLKGIHSPIAVYRVLY